MKAVKIGLIGLGTIGSGTAKILLEKRQELKRKTGIDFVLKKICDKNIEKAKKAGINSKILTTNANEILKDPEIDIVIELIGGIHPAKEFILTALKNKKHVVTANKALLSEECAEIFETAKKQNRAIGYEASVCGGIPIIKVLSEGLVANEIKQLFGIVNGTCNYILTKMAEEKMSFEDALKLAQEKGFAEANPALDIEGTDSCHKLALLALTAHGMEVKPSEIYTEGISKISKQDIELAEEMGYCIKLLAIMKKTNGELELRVHPTMIPKTKMLASVRNEYNAVFVKGDIVGSTMFSGKGAGKMPTTSAVIADVVEIAQKILQKTERFCSIEFKKTKLEPMSKIESNYYLRFTVEDKPGVLAKISKSLGDNKVSIASVIQKEENKKTVPLILITHKTTEERLQKSVKQINKLDCIKEKTRIIRVEQD